MAKIILFNYLIVISGLCLLFFFTNQISCSPVSNSRVREQPYDLSNFNDLINVVIGEFNRDLGEKKMYAKNSQNEVLAKEDLGGGSKLGKSSENKQIQLLKQTKSIRTVEVLFEVIENIILIYELVNDIERLLIDFINENTNRIH